MRVRSVAVVPVMMFLAVAVTAAFQFATPRPADSLPSANALRPEVPGGVEAKSIREMIAALQGDVRRLRTEVTGLQERAKADELKIRQLEQSARDAGALGESVSRVRAQVAGLASSAKLDESNLVALSQRLAGHTHQYSYVTVTQHSDGSLAGVKYSMKHSLKPDF